MLPAQPADTFELHDADINVIYTTRGGEAKLTYSQVSVPGEPKVFKTNDIRTVTTEIGNLVSVTFESQISPILGSAKTIFSLLLPNVNVVITDNPNGGSADVAVYAIYTDLGLSGPAAVHLPAHQQNQSYRVTFLKGTASTPPFVTA
jgi:hypothetical protein